MMIVMIDTTNIPVWLPTALTFAFRFGYLVVERKMRKGEGDDKSMKGSAVDGSSTRANFASMSLNLTLTIAAAIVGNPAYTHNVNRHGGRVADPWRYTGVLLMALGLLLRYSAAKILGAYYSRTLKVQKDQDIITDLFPYNIIRHPGYLGVTMIDSGSYLAVGARSSWMMLGMSIFACVFHYRMNTEEKMLHQQFGDKYKAYCHHTWRMIPFIY
jgi:protein-S-isoprenylcysteine O-methyltransferase Ste14